MPIFVIGGTGFIGTRVIRRLAARGEEVAVMDINAPRPLTISTSRCGSRGAM
jgi:nucleoside-diphosphate-sugar epimerase